MCLTVVEETLFGENHLPMKYAVRYTIFLICVAWEQYVRGGFYILTSGSPSEAAVIIR